MAVKKIFLASPRGFCAGVDRAIDTVKLAIEKFGAPVYVKHQIVHNKHVVKGLEKEGAITVATVEEIPDGANAIFSAHGSPPADYIRAAEKDLNLIDATCPLVTKVHLEARRFSNDHKIIYIGKRDHKEAIGVIAEAPDKIFLVQDENDIEKIPFLKDDRIICLTQTTLNVNDTNALIEKIKEKYPQAALPPGSDICFSTTNRQDAVKELAKKVDLVIVVGSKNSSNSNKLVEVAKDSGSEAFLVDDASELLEELPETIGISAGASAPEWLVQEIISQISDSSTQVIELHVVDENMKFPMPKGL